MKIVIAPNAFKGCLSAVEAASAMAEGVHRAAPGYEVVRLPVSDGGDGLLEVMASVLDGELRSARVPDPLGRSIDAQFLWCAGDGTAVIEMARASGLVLLADHERNPVRTSTRGTGVLIEHALNLGAGRIVVGVGGSATCDGGTGMASALGIRFLDTEGEPIEPCGGSLQNMARIDATARNPAVARTPVEVMCDVDNPLLGDQGAARVYAPQKGASPAQVDRLETGMRHLAQVIQRDLGIDVAGLRGGGAAGGIGAGLHAFIGATLRPGAPVVLELLRFSEHLEKTDLVLTGEGCLDDQTLNHKAPAGVARMAAKHGIPCIAIAGSVKADETRLRGAGFTRSYVLSGRSLSDVVENLIRGDFDPGDFVPGTKSP